MRAGGLHRDDVFNVDATHRDLIFGIDRLSESREGTEPQDKTRSQKPEARSQDERVMACGSPLRASGFGLLASCLVSASHVWSSCAAPMSVFAFRMIVFSCG